MRRLREISSYKLIVLCASLGAFVFLMCAILISAHHYLKSTTDISTDAASLAQCYTVAATTTEDARIACTEEKVSQLLKKYSVKSILSYIIAKTSPTTIVNNCHLIAHVIGEQNYDTSSSLEGALGKCSADCRNGCVHGTVGEAILKQMGSTAANEDIEHSTSAAQVLEIGGPFCNSSSMCHAIGHILFQLTKTYSKALTDCDIVASSTTSIARESCYQGVFMESLGSVSSLQLNTPSVPTYFNDYSAPCSTIPAQYQHACLQYLPNFQDNAFVAHNITDTTTILNIREEACNSFQGNTRVACYVGIGYYNWNRLVSNPLSARQYCNSLPDSQSRLACSLGLVLGAGQNLYTQESLYYCAGTTDNAAKALCYDAVFQTANDLVSQNNLLIMCSALSNPADCTEHEAVYLASSTTLPIYAEDPEI